MALHPLVDKFLLPVLLLCAAVALLITGAMMHLGELTNVGTFLLGGGAALPVNNRITDYARQAPVEMTEVAPVAVVTETVATTAVDTLPKL